MRSQYNNTQIYEQESRLYIEKICLEYCWKFRSYDHDNDIDGEIEIFDKVSIDDKEINESQAKFLKVQLKASTDIEYKNNYVKFICPVKLLHFVDVCDQPIILVLYDVNKKSAYWLWLQEYIYINLDNDNPGWRNNKNSVTLYIPIDNEVSTNKDFKRNIENIASNGSKEIFQLRKKETIDYYITEISHKDMSNTFDRRISIKILVEKSFSESKAAMDILIKKLNDRYKQSDYFRDEKIKHLHSENVDVLWIFIYNDIRQVNDGLPYCRTEWTNPKSDVKISKMNGDEKINNIEVTWGQDYKFIEKNYVENRMSKGQYMSLLDNTFKDVKKIKVRLDEFIDKYNKNKISCRTLISKFQSYSSKISDLLTTYETSDLPPYECDDVDQKMNELLISLDNIGIILNDTKRTEDNKIWGINFYYNDFKEKLPEYLYERKKIG